MVVGMILATCKIAVAYAWPSYLTYKALKGGGDVHRWCVYWCVLGAAASLELLGDCFLFWLPLYRAMKIVMAVYLWHPLTNGAQIIYQNFLLPYLTDHEAMIDAKAEEMTTWMQDISVQWKEAAMTTLSRGALAVLEKAQEIRSPTHGNSPRISAFRDDPAINKDGISTKEL